MFSPSAQQKMFKVVDEPFTALGKREPVRDLDQSVIGVMQELAGIVGEAIEPWGIGSDVAIDVEEGKVVLQLPAGSMDLEYGTVDQAATPAVRHAIVSNEKRLNDALSVRLMERIGL